MVPPVGLNRVSLNLFVDIGAAWEALQRIQRADVIESVDTRDYSKNIAAFAGAGYDLIITSGAGLRDETLQAAQAHVGILFVGLDQEPADSPLPNFVAVETQILQCWSFSARGSSSL